MTHWPTPPRILLSTRTSRLLTVASTCDIAATANMDGVELDLGGRLWPPRPDRVANDVQDSDARIESVWIRRVMPGPGVTVRQRGAIRAAVAMAAATGAGTIVVDHLGSLDAAAAIASQDLVPRNLVNTLATGDARLTVALPTEQLEGNRSHLTELLALRRIAEEWDFYLGLDLLGPIDPRWEAEAAGARMGPRLRLIRIGLLESRPPGRGRAKMTHRVLAAAADAGFGGLISIAVGPGWHAWWPPALAGVCAATVSRIRDQFALVQEPFVGHPNPNPNPNPRFP